MAFSLLKLWTSASQRLFLLENSGDHLREGDANGRNNSVVLSAEKEREAKEHCSDEPLTLRP